MAEITKKFNRDYVRIACVDGQNRNSLREIISDKKLLLLLLFIVAAGIFVRLYKFSEVGYWGDDETTIPTGLLWFYGHTYYPGLLGQGEPAFGNYIVGRACMLSGEDFSGVTQFQSRFYPGREILIGPQLARANNYCHAPMYIFGIIFFLAIILFASMLLGKYGTIFIALVVAFNPFFLQFSRWIHVDIFLYAFTVLGLIFLLMALRAEKGNRLELFWWLLAIAMMALAFSVKLPASMYMLFSGLMISIKYWPEIKYFLHLFCRKLDLGFFKNVEHPNYCRSYIILALLAIGVSGFIFQYTFEGLSNIPVVIKAYQLQAAELSHFVFNKQFISNTIGFLLYFSNLELIFLIAGIFYIPYFAMRSVKGSLNDKFILCLLGLWLFLLLSLPTMSLERVYFLFSFGILLMSGMVMGKLADRVQLWYGHHKGKLIYIFIILIIMALPLFMAIYASPDFIINDRFYNILKSPKTISSPATFGGRWIGEYLSGMLGPNETYFTADQMNIPTYYVRHNQQLLYYLFRENFKSKMGRSPSVDEYIQYFKPNGQRIRYLLIDPVTQNQEPYVQGILNNYKPMHIIYQPSIRKVETIRVYDLDNLQKKK